jgi:hypothetical protein
MLWPLYPAKCHKYALNRRQVWPQILSWCFEKDKNLKSSDKLRCPQRTKLSMRIKQLEREVNYQCPTTSEMMNEWR